MRFSAAGGRDGQGHHRTVINTGPIYGGFHSGGTSIARWMVDFRENPTKIWMMRTGGSPILGNSHLGMNIH